MLSRGPAALAFALAIAAAGTAGPARAAQDGAVMATVRQFVDGFNKGDAKMATAACASPVSIIDDFPPHAWQGATACADWASAYAVSAKESATTDGIVTLGKPWRVDVTGDRAYVVVPATFAYRDHGKPVTETGAVFTVALRRLAAGWRITGWAWSRH
jgi:hypothetical protein